MRPVVPGKNATGRNTDTSTTPQIGTTYRMTFQAPLTLSASYTYTKTRVTDAGIDSSATANFVRGDWIKPHAVVVDAGYNEGIKEASHDRENWRQDAARQARLRYCRTDR